MTVKHTEDNSECQAPGFLLSSSRFHDLEARYLPISMGPLPSVHLTSACSDKDDPQLSANIKIWSLNNSSGCAQATQTIVPGLFILAGGRALSSAGSL